MSLRTRFTAATSALSVVTLGLSFGLVYVAVNRAQERQLDDALSAEAVEEAGEAASIGGDHLAISDGPGPTANDVGPLTKYGVIFDARGRAVASTTTFLGTSLPGEWHAHASFEPFDTWFASTHLRAVLVPIPDGRGSRLLLAAPRTDLDGDAAFLGRAMLLVFAVASVWSVAITTAVVRRLTRAHQEIAEVALRVAEGDFTARVRERSADAETRRLATNVNHMVEQIEQLLESQQLFIAHAAHELRAPVTRIHARASLALRRRRTAEEYREALAETSEATRDLSALADDLLTLATTAADDTPDTSSVDVDASAVAGVACSRRIRWSPPSRVRSSHAPSHRASRCRGSTRMAATRSSSSPWESWIRCGRSRSSTRTISRASTRARASR